MELIYQIHNIGIYMDSPTSAWGQRTREMIKQQLDCFELYLGAPVEYRLLIKDPATLKGDGPGIVVPENTKYLDDGTYISYEYKIAFRLNGRDLHFWVNDHTWLTPYMLNYLFEMQGTSFVHGAGISQNGDGILLLAFGGIGKTCFIAKALQMEGVRFLGDDLILAARDGTVLSYPRPLCLYPYHKSLFPGYFKQENPRIVTIKDDDYWKRGMRLLKRKLGVKEKAHYNYAVVSPFRIFDKEKLQVGAVPLKRAYVLRRIAGVPVCVKLPCPSVEEAAAFALNVIMFEWDVGLRIQCNRLAHLKQGVDSYLQEKHNNILACLRAADSIEYIDIPEHMSAEQVSVCLTDLVLGEKNDHR